MAGFGSEGWGIADSFKIDPSIEKMALAEQANQEKAAQKKQQSDNAYTEKLSGAITVDKGLLPGYADMAAKDGSDTIQRMLANKNLYPNSYYNKNAQEIADYKGRAGQYNANSENLKFANQHLENYDPDTQQKITAAVAAKTGDELKNIKASSSSSNFQNNDGNMTFSRVGNVTNADQPENYLNLDHNKVPLDTVQQQIAGGGSGMTKIMKMSAVPKDKEDLNTIADAIGLTGDNKDQFMKHQTVEDLAASKFDNNANVQSQYKGLLLSKLGEPTNQDPSKSNADLFEDEKGNPLDASTIANNVRNEYIAYAKTVPTSTIGESIVKNNAPKEAKVTGNAGSGLSLNATLGTTPLTYSDGSKTVASTVPYITIKEKSGAKINNIELDSGQTGFEPHYIKENGQWKPYVLVPNLKYNKDKPDSPTNSYNIEYPIKSAKERTEFNAQVKGFDPNAFEASQKSGSSDNSSNDDTPVPKDTKTNSGGFDAADIAKYGRGVKTSKTNP